MDEAPRVEEIHLPRTPEAMASLSARERPAILRGLVADWPVVRAAREGQAALLDYLLRFDAGRIVPIAAGTPGIGGRIFYNEDFTGLNVDRGRAHFASFLREVDRQGREDPAPLIYMASTDIPDAAPGFEAENRVDFEGLRPLESLWIGTPSRIAAHNDLPMNLACIAAGTRRFTLFPPHQTANLYPGPFELTPAGRPVSLVDFHAPDLSRFPLFAEAMGEAAVADLEPGDALYIPSMWWHHVEATAPFNILVNYWWRSVPAWLGTPQDVLHHAMLTLRDMPANEREIWRDLFDHYVFRNDPQAATAHIPPHARGMLDPMTEEMARRMRAFLLNRLNR
ncbi:cupin-like domain-containing protein [Hyphomonas sp.]|uniref:cupin-like domain-containing protein n=1 Tax=Hyphomonas sp. TaxID=87 RepID=UPI00391C9EBC